MVRSVSARTVFDAPVQVIAGRDGTVTLFLPDGHRVVMTTDAAIRSGAMLSRTRQRVRTGQVIKADFAARTAEPLGNPGDDPYMAVHHGSTDTPRIRQEENRRGKSPRAVRLPH